MVVSSFTINGVNSSFLNTDANYYNVLNGGNVENNTLQYTFTLTELLGHIVDYFLIDSYLFTNTGEIDDPKTVTIGLQKDSINYTNYQGTIVSSENNPFSLRFNNTDLIEESNSVQLKLTVSSNEVTLYGLFRIIVSLKDTLQDIRYTFSGPTTGRTVNKITVSTLILNKGVEVVTFSKDPTSNFSESVEGQIQFRKNGIFVDGYQYSINTIATTNSNGVVKLSENSFETDNEGIIPPSDVGVAATPQLVYNTLATAKNYTDETMQPLQLEISEINLFIEGIEAPIIVKVDTGNEEVGFGNTMIFSTDFKKQDNKLYINWLELV